MYSFRRIIALLSCGSAGGTCWFFGITFGFPSPAARARYCYSSPPLPPDRVRVHRYFIPQTVFSSVYVLAYHGNLPYRHKSDVGYIYNYCTTSYLPGYPANCGVHDYVPGPKVQHSGKDQIQINAFPSLEPLKSKIYSHKIYGKYNTLPSINNTLITTSVRSVKLPVQRVGRPEGVVPPAKIHSDLHKRPHNLRYSALHIF